MPLTVLITGFGPFPGAPFNPTAALAKTLAQRRRPALSEINRVAYVFPTSYAAVERELPILIARHRPDLVLLFGLAPRTPHLRIEGRARNRRSTLFADIDGTHPTSGIRPRGPSALIAPARQQPLRIAATRARVPVRLSIDAGKYLCNFTYWRALEFLRDSGALVQFVHVPNVPRTGAGTRSYGRKHRRLTEADLLRGAEAILLALVVATREVRRNRECRFAAVRSSSDFAATKTDARRMTHQNAGSSKALAPA
jgi:pyroglutamyl-peptidase